MRISDWSSDVCSSDLQYRSCRKATRSNFGGRAGRRRFALNRRRKIWQCEQTNDAQTDKHKKCTLDAAGRDDPGQERSEEHTSELQSLMRISYAVFCLKKKRNKNCITNTKQHYHPKATYIST